MTSEQEQVAMNLLTHIAKVEPSQEESLEMIATMAYGVGYVFADAGHTSIEDFILDLLLKLKHLLP